MEIKNTFLNRYSLLLLFFVVLGISFWGINVLADACKKCGCASILPPYVCGWKGVTCEDYCETGCAFCDTVLSSNACIVGNEETSCPFGAGCSGDPDCSTLSNICKKDSVPTTNNTWNGSNCSINADSPTTGSACTWGPGDWDASSDSCIICSGKKEGDLIAHSTTFNCEVGHHGTGYGKCESACGLIGDDVNCDEQDPNSSWQTVDACYWCTSLCGYGAEWKPPNYYSSGSTCYYNCTVTCGVGGWTRTGCSSCDMKDCCVCISSGCDNTGSCPAGETCQSNCLCQSECECTTGVCCDGCNYWPSSYVCDSQYAVDYGCPDGEGYPYCGADVKKRYKTQKCSGSEDTTCTGSVSDWGSYTLHDDCTSTETCADDDSTCNYTAACDITCSDYDGNAAGCRAESGCDWCEDCTSAWCDGPKYTSCSIYTGKCKNSCEDCRYSCSGPNCKKGSPPIGCNAQCETVDDCTLTCGAGLVEICDQNDCTCKCTSCQNNICQMNGCSFVDEDDYPITELEPGQPFKVQFTYYTKNTYELRRVFSPWDDRDNPSYFKIGDAGACTDETETTDILYAPTGPDAPGTYEYEAWCDYSFTTCSIDVIDTVAPSVSASIPECFCPKDPCPANCPEGSCCISYYGETETICEKSCQDFPLISWGPTDGLSTDISRYDICYRKCLTGDLTKCLEEEIGDSKCCYPDCDSDENWEEWYRNMDSGFTGDEFVKGSPVNLYLFQVKAYDKGPFGDGNDPNVGWSNVAVMKVVDECFELEPGLAEFSQSSLVPSILDLSSPQTIFLEVPEKAMVSSAPIKLTGSPDYFPTRDLTIKVGNKEVYKHRGKFAYEAKGIYGSIPPELFIDSGAGYYTKTGGYFAGDQELKTLVNVDFTYSLQKLLNDGCSFCQDMGGYWLIPIKVSSKSAGKIILGSLKINGSAKNFSSGGSSETIEFTGAGFDTSVKMEIPKGAVITSAEIYIKGDILNTSYPLSPILDIGNDGSPEWKFGCAKGEITQDLIKPALKIKPNTVVKDPIVWLNGVEYKYTGILPAGAEASFDISDTLKLGSHNVLNFDSSASIFWEIFDFKRATFNPGGILKDIKLTVTYNNIPAYQTSADGAHSHLCYSTAGTEAGGAHSHTVTIDGQDYPTSECPDHYHGAEDFFDYNDCYYIEPTTTHSHSHTINIKEKVYTSSLSAHSHTCNYYRYGEGCRPDNNLCTEAPDHSHTFYIPDSDHIGFTASINGQEFYSSFDYSDIHIPGQSSAVSKTFDIPDGVIINGNNEFLLIADFPITVNWSIVGNKYLEDPEEAGKVDLQVNGEISNAKITFIGEGLEIGPILYTKNKPLTDGTSYNLTPHSSHKGYIKRAFLYVGTGGEAPKCHIKITADEEILIDADWGNKWGEDDPKYWTEKTFNLNSNLINSDGNLNVQIWVTGSYDYDGTKYCADVIDELSQIRLDYTLAVPSRYPGVTINGETVRHTAGDGELKDGAIATYDLPNLTQGVNHLDFSSVSPGTVLTPPYEISADTSKTGSGKFNWLITGNLTKTIDLASEINEYVHNNCPQVDCVPVTHPRNCDEECQARGGTCLYGDASADCSTGPGIWGCGARDVSYCKCKFPCVIPITFSGIGSLIGFSSPGISILKGKDGEAPECLAYNSPPTVEIVRWEIGCIWPLVTLEFIYKDPDGDAMAMGENPSYHIEIYDKANWDNRKTSGVALISRVVNIDSTSPILSGSTICHPVDDPLPVRKDGYYWRVRVWDDKGNVSKDTYDDDEWFEGYPEGYEIPAM